MIQLKWQRGSNACEFVARNHVKWNLCDYSSQKNGSIVGATKASFLGGRKLRVSKHKPVSVGSRSVGVVCTVADPDRPIWFPGSTPPPWLDGRYLYVHRDNIQSTLVICMYTYVWVRVPSKRSVCLMLLKLNLNTATQPTWRLRLWSSWSR